MLLKSIWSDSTGGFITTKFTAIYLPNYLILEIMNIFKFIESFTNDDLMQSQGSRRDSLDSLAIR
jgi:hypothetical protein